MTNTNNPNFPFGEREARLHKVMILAHRMAKKGFSFKVALSYAHSYFKNPGNKIEVQYIKKSTQEIVE